MSSRIAAVLVLLVVLVGLGAAPAAARVDRVEILSRKEYWDGKPFGGAGPYERIQALVYYALDPRDPHNSIIADLDRAPRNARGEVEVTGDVDILRPKRAAAGSDVLLIDVPNRGGRFLIREPNAPNFDDWYLRQGYTLAEVAWQFDVRPDPALLHLAAPVARGVRGHVRSDFVVAEATGEHTIGHFIGGSIGGTGYPVADPSDATLTERAGPLAPRRTIPRSRWRFSGERTIQLDGGFIPGKLYEVIYTAADPAVVGTGLAAVRDFASYAKNDPASPAHAAHVYAMGISQTGRFLRHFVWQGFNADEAGRQVFDGLVVYVAGAGRGNFNHRFAQPSRDAQPLSPSLYPVDVFPFTDEPETDPVTGERGGLLDRARAADVVPKIFYVNTAYEYWSRAASLIHTTPDGTKDVAPAETSRIYFIAGLGHVAGKFPPAIEESPERRGQTPVNPNNIIYLRHGFVAAMDAWVRFGVDPPLSMYPTLRGGALVKPAALSLKSIEGVAVPRFAYDAYRIVGSDEPPKVRGTYVNLVPQIGGDGNEYSGLRLPEISVPVASYTGWNLRSAEIGFPDYRASFIGAYIAWPKETIDKLYKSPEEYFGRFAAAALGLVVERFIVADDLPAILTRGRQEYWFAESQAAR